MPDDLFDVRNVALIPPAPEVHWTGQMTFHLAEAPIVLTDKKYALEYKFHTERGHYVIMDNGAALGRTVSDTNLVKAAIEVNADEVVVPDEMANRGTTKNRAEVFLKNYGSLFDTLMFVPQGVNFESWYASLNELLELAKEYNVKRTIIGIGKHMHKRVDHGRGTLVTQCHLMGLTVHLLGASDEPLEDLYQLGQPNVRGYDTSLPFALAQLDITLLEKPTKQAWCEPPLEGKRPPLDFFKETWPLGHKNMETFLRWVHERQPARVSN